MRRGREEIKSVGVRRQIPFAGKNTVSTFFPKVARKVLARISRLTALEQLLIPDLTPVKSLGRRIPNVSAYLDKCVGPSIFLGDLLPKDTKC